jgi:hypothetical protein
MFLVKCYFTKINVFWIKPNLLSKERSFTKKGLFCCAKTGEALFLAPLLSGEGIGNPEGGF